MSHSYLISCMRSQYDKKRKKRRLVPVYYYTLPFAAAMIAAQGFRAAGSGDGAGGGGVVFTLLSPASFDVGSFEYEENLILSCLGADNLEEFREQHKLDLCVVYGAEPRALRRPPGGLDTAKVLTRAYFEALGEAEAGAGDYHLRPDRILALFMLDPAKPPSGFLQAVDQLDAEKAKDNAVVKRLRVVEGVARYNAAAAG